jgi:hypothetical protein
MVDGSFGGQGRKTMVDWHDTGFFAEGLVKCLKYTLKDWGSSSSSSVILLQLAYLALTRTSMQ